MPEASYQIIRPARRDTSVIFASPHSGRDYPRSFLGRTLLCEHTIRSSEDAFVDKLFMGASAMGAPLLLAGAPRAFVDVNRSADELDPALIEGVRRAAQNPRVASGLGVIPRVVANGRAIYRGKLTRGEAERRIRAYWEPYHAALGRLLQESHAQFGEAILIDCHSMPHEAVESPTIAGGRRPQVVLGDRFGAAAAPAVVERVEQAFSDAGFRVVRNAPFAGAYVSRHYGRPSRNQHVVQIEIDRALYMDERKIEPLPEFDLFRRRLEGVIGEIVGLGRVRRPLAAE